MSTPALKAATALSPPQQSKISNSMPNGKPFAMPFLTYRLNGKPVKQHEHRMSSRTRIICFYYISYYLLNKALTPNLAVSFVFVFICGFYFECALYLGAGLVPR